MDLGLVFGGAGALLAALGVWVTLHQVKRTAELTKSEVQARSDYAIADLQAKAEVTRSEMNAKAEVTSIEAAERAMAIVTRRMEDLDQELRNERVARRDLELELEREKRRRSELETTVDALRLQIQQLKDHIAPLATPPSSQSTL